MNSIKKRLDVKDKYRRPVCYTQVFFYEIFIFLKLICHTMYNKNIIEKMIEDELNKWLEENCGGY